MIHKRAFTIVELLLATVLSSILMIGVLRVTGSIRPLLTREPPSSSKRWSSPFIDLFRWDLTNARTIWQKENRITLVGYDALDRHHFGWQHGSTDSSQHHPVQVEYYLWSSQDGQSWLMRRQTHITEQTNRNAWSEVVASGVASIAVRRPSGGPDDLMGVIDDATPVLWLGRPSPVPDLVNLAIELTDGSTSIDELMIVR